MAFDAAGVRVLLPEVETCVTMPRLTAVNSLTTAGVRRIMADSSNNLMYCVVPGQGVYINQRILRRILNLNGACMSILR